ncbi:MAG: TonB family protein [Deltaproteobacteria bacterium]|nr:TonB family protein [Deltaproteobacteria bacterium]
MTFRIYTAFTVLVLLQATTVLSQTTEKTSDETSDKAEPPVLMPPKLVEYVQADYPKEALEKKLEAEVVAKLNLDENGLVVGVEITAPAGHGFDEAAEAAMYKFVFTPATMDGQPMASQVIYRYTFYLKEEEPKPEDLPPPVANLSGVVSDMDGKPVPQASVMLTPILSQTAANAEEQAERKDISEDIPDPSVTDADGKFAFLYIAPGAYQIDIVAPGFKPFTATEDLEDGETRELIYRLELEEVLYETVVRARRPPREVTRRELSRREITRIPGTGGDALRSVQNMPGMARAPFMSGDLIVRGSSPKDSQYFFDQMPVPMLYHFFGLKSIINSDLLEQIDFFPGNYDVRYGGATGGIVEVYPRIPSTDRLHAYVNADFWDITGFVETPLGDKWSIAVSGRRSYIFDLLTATMPDNGGMSATVAPRYYDYQLVVNYHPQPKDELQLFVFGTDDELLFVMGDSVADNPNVTGGFGMGIYLHQAQLRWEHRFSKALSNKANIGTGIQSNKFDIGNFLDYEDKIFPVYFRDEFIYDNNDLVALRTGIDATVMWAEWKVRAPNILPTEGQEMDPLDADMEMSETKNKGTYYRTAWYGEFELRPVSDLRLINGLRVEYFSQVAQVGLDPRFVLRYEIIEGTTIKGGIGLFHQAPQGYETDKGFGNPDLDLITAIHYSVGVEQQIVENLEVSVEGFFKDISNLVVNSEEIVERDGEMVPEMYNNEGRGHAYGLEFLLRYPETERFFGWLSYTLMKSKRIDHPGENSRLFDYDQTHILTLVASLVLGRGWEAGVRFRLVSGNPETPVTGAVYESDSDIYFPMYGETNSTRLSTFHQLDVRVDKKWTWKYLKLAIYIEVLNVYNQKNAEGYEYNYDYTDRKFFYGLPILPNFGIKLEY